MSMILSEQILTGAIIALVSGIIGKFIGERGKVTRMDCSERQSACMKIVCVELAHIKEELAYIRELVGEMTGKALR